MSYKFNIFTGTFDIVSVAAAVVNSLLLLETGDYFLLETGDKLILES